MYAVRSKAGRIVQRFATRAAAERFVRGRTATSPTSGDLGEVARIRVREPLLQERVQTTVPVRIRMSGIDEEWALVVTRGKSPPYGIVNAGRVLIVLPGSSDLSEPLAGLVWAKEHGKTYVHQVWVDPEAQRRGVSRMLLDAYRSNVARTLIMKGPFSAGGEALARAAKAKMMRSPPWKKEGLADLMRQGFMRPRTARKATPWTLTPKDNERGYGLLYDISCNGRVGMIGRAAGGGSDYYVIENGDITSRGHRTVQQAAKAFAKGSRT